MRERNEGKSTKRNERRGLQSICHQRGGITISIASRGSFISVRTLPYSFSNSASCVLALPVAGAAEGPRPMYRRAKAITISPSVVGHDNQIDRTRGICVVLQVERTWFLAANCGLQFEVEHRPSHPYSYALLAPTPLQHWDSGWLPCQPNRKGTEQFVQFEQLQHPSLYLPSLVVPQVNGTHTT